MNNDGSSFISCNYIIVKDATALQVASHHFGIKNSIKDITLEEIFKTMYRTFLYIVNKGSVKEDDHYFVTLRFKTKAW